MTRDNTERSGMNSESAMPVAAKKESTPMMFSAPSEFVELPSGGKFYPSDHPLHNVKEVEIRHMTAREEDILTNVALIKKGTAIDRMLQSILVSPNVPIEQFLSGDKNALTIAARITGFGAEYETKVHCPACGEVSDFEFDLNEAAVNDGTDLSDNVEMTENGTFVISNLPSCDKKVEVKLMTGRDELALSKSQEQKKKNNLPPTTVTDQLKMIIVSLDGSTKAKDINDFVDTMPLRATKALRKIYNDITPNVDLTQDFVCRHCDFSDRMEVPFSTEFFWPKQ